MGSSSKKRFDDHYKLLKKALKEELKQSRPAYSGQSEVKLSSEQAQMLAQEMVEKLLSGELSTTTAERSSSVPSTAPSTTLSTTPSTKTSTIEVLHIEPSPGSMAFALTPHKTSPCKKCPALAGGLCKCALKQSQKKRKVG